MSLGILSERLTVGEASVGVLRTEGASPPVLMLHSSGLGARQWRPLMRLMGERSCIAPNMHGYDPDVPWRIDDPRAFDWSTDAAIVEAALDRWVGNDPVDVAGHSYGGFLALHLARTRPERVRRIALHEPVVWGLLRTAGTTEATAGFDGLIEQLYAPDITPGGDAWLEGFVDFWNRPGAWGQMPEDRRNDWRRLGLKVAGEVWMLCHERTAPADLQAVHHPVQITLGERSPEWERVVCQLLLGALPNASLIDVQGGHMAPLTHARDVLPVMAAFLLAQSQR